MQNNGGYMKILIKLFIIAGAVLFALSCASTAPASRSSGSGQGSGSAASKTAADDVYAGIGEDPSLGKAIAEAKMNAVKNAVIDMIGAAAEEANAEKLNEVLYNTSNPNAYVIPETMENTRKENVGTTDDMMMLYEITIKVNKEAIRTTLDAAGITGSPDTASGGRGGEKGGGDRDAVAEKADTEDLALQEDDWEDATEEDKRFIRRYVDNLTYMVYFNEESGEDPFIMKSAVSMANSFLAENSMSAVDMAQVEALRKDQQLAYEEETGQQVSIIQWIAQKLNADVYIEIDAVTNGETKGDNHYGTANITLKMFETSTGELLGSLPYRSQRTFSRVSQQDAILNAIQSTIFKAMPVAVEQSREKLLEAFSKGIRYQVIIQNTPDSRVVSDFRRSLRKKVPDVETVSQSAEETVYNVYFYGRIDELEDLIYDISENVPGMESIYQVLTRGKSITFDSGI
jgi:hypothetical protein